MLNLAGKNISAVDAISENRYLNDSQSASAVVLDCAAAISSNRW